MAKKIVSPIAVGDLVYVHNAVFQGQRGGHCEHMKAYQGKSFVIDRFVDDYGVGLAVFFTKASMDAKGLRGGWTWDVRCFRRLRKAKNVPVPITKPTVVTKPVAAAKPIDPPIDQLRKNLEEKVAMNGVGLCSFAQMQVETNKESYHLNAACHASVNTKYCFSNGVVGISAFVLNISGHLKDLKYKNPELGLMYERYVKYMLDESPWKDCFVPESMDVRWAKGVLCDVTKATEILKAGAIALREQTEFGQRLPLFSEILGWGNSGNTAKLLAACFTKISDKVYNYRSFSNGHQIWHPDFDTEELFAFFRNGFPKKSLEVKGANTTREISFTVANWQASQTKVKDKMIDSYILKEFGIKETKGGWREVVNNNVSIDKLKAFAKKLDVLLNKEWK